MRTVTFKLKWAMFMLLIVCSLLTACSSGTYASSGNVKISDALDGADWPLSVPAPAYFGKFLAKFKSPDSAYAEIHFLSVTKNELTDYIKALRSAGFNLTPVVYQFVSASIANERAAMGDYDYYEAVKGNLELDVSAKPGPYDDTYIIIRGLPDADMKALKVQSIEEEIEDLGGYAVAGFGTSKEYLVDIGNSLEGQIQREIMSSNPYWLASIPAPSFIDRIASWPGSVMQSFSGEGIALSYDEIDMQEMVDYLLLLISKGYEVVQPIYYEYFENAKPHGALDYQNFASFHSLTDVYNGSLVIRAENGRYALTFSLDRNYIVRALYKGDKDVLSLYPDKEQVSFRLDVTGLSPEELLSIGIEPYIQDNATPPVYFEDVLNHSPYTSEEVYQLIMYAEQMNFISPDETMELIGVLLGERNIDKVLEHEGIKRALE